MAIYQALSVGKQVGNGRQSRQFFILCCQRSLSEFCSTRYLLCRLFSETDVKQTMNIIKNKKNLEIINSRIKALEQLVDNINN